MNNDYLKARLLIMSADLALIMLVGINPRRSRSRSDVDNADGHLKDNFTSSETLQIEHGNVETNVHCVDLINKRQNENEKLKKQEKNENVRRR